jgi:hypothetical protein
MKIKLNTIALLSLLSFELFSQIPNYVPVVNLVAWYSFNGNANDLSGNGYNGTLQNGVASTTDRFSNPNSAYNFDGIDDRIYINNAFFNNGWNAYTISGWINLAAIPNPNNGNSNHVMFNTSAHNGLALGMNWGSSNKYAFSLGNGAPAISWNVLFNGLSAQNLSANTWKMVTLMKSSTSYSLFINGTLDASWTNLNSIQSYFYKMYLGSTDPAVGSEVLLGKLDDFGIWDRVLSPCELAQLYAASTITPALNITATNTVICAGSSTTLSVSGANSYTWSNGGNGSSIIVSPNLPTTYTVVGTLSTGCLGVGTSSILINFVPTLSVSATNTAGCIGYTTTLNGTGAQTYTWSNGITNGVPFIPGVTTTHTLLGSNSCGTSTAIASVIVFPLPTVSAVASSTVVCAGGTLNLLGTGALTYSWSGGVLNAVPFAPITTKAYTLTGTDSNGCSARAVITVSVANCTGIENIASTVSKLTFQIYPNPNNGEFTIELLEGTEVTIVNALGQTIMQLYLNAGKNKIDLNDHAKGIYFVQRKSFNESVKLVKE